MRASGGRCRDLLLIVVGTVRIAAVAQQVPPAVNVVATLVHGAYASVMSAISLDFAAILREELDRVHELFQPDELAYLALTSKIELQVRDRLAFALYRRLGDRLIAREWKRVDLAVLASDGETPEMLLEAKALYTFDLIGNQAWVSRYPNMVKADLAALCARQDLTERTQLFALVLATHPSSQATAHLKHVAKYSRGVGKAIGSHGDAAAVLRQADEALRASLPHAGDIHAGEIPGGVAYDVSVNVPYWLVASSRSGSSSDGFKD